MLAGIGVPILGSPSARAGSTGGIDVRGVAFGPGLSSKWRVAVVVNAREALSLEDLYEEVRMLLLEWKVRIPEELIVIVCVVSADKMRRSLKPLFN
jgi:hypothetical protein